MNTTERSAFTLIELLVVIAIIAILSVVVILTLNPAELLRQSRDSNRVSDLATLTNAVNLYNVDQGGSASFSLGSAATVYPSLADQTATTTAGTNCASLSLISLPATYNYHCAASSTPRLTSGTGWIPVNFSVISSGAPIGNLPVDPINNSSSRLYYSYIANGSQFEMTTGMESQKYKLGGTGDMISTDGGNLIGTYEKGTQIGLQPLDYGDSSLIGYWPFTEGTGTIAYDESGSGKNMIWVGTQSGTTGYYSAGKIGALAGFFNGTNNTASTTNVVTTATTNLTMLMWFNPSVVTTSVLMYNGNTGANGYGLYISDGASCAAGVKLNVLFGGRSCAAVGTSYTVTAGAWYMVALTLNGNITTLYVNGAVIGTGSVATANIPTGSTYAIQTSAFTGLVNDVRFYNRALSATEIQAIYNAQK